MLGLGRAQHTLTVYKFSATRAYIPTQALPPLLLAQRISTALQNKALSINITDSPRLSGGTFLFCRCVRGVLGVAPRFEQFPFRPLAAFLRTRYGRAHTYFYQRVLAAFQKDGGLWSVGTVQLRFTDGLHLRRARGGRFAFFAHASRLPTHRMPRAPRFSHAVDAAGVYRPRTKPNCGTANTSVPLSARYGYLSPRRLRQHLMSGEDGLWDFLATAFGPPKPRLSSQRGHLSTAHYPAQHSPSLLSVAYMPVRHHLAVHC